MLVYLLHQFTKHIYQMNGYTLTLHFMDNSILTEQVRDIRQAQRYVTKWQREFGEYVIYQKHLINNKTGKTIW